MTSQQIISYFDAEKAESLLFFCIGIIGLATGIICIFYLKTKFAYGLSVPLIAIALIQIIVGGTVYLRTDKQVEQLLGLYNQSPKLYAAEELSRMAKVNKSFDVYKIIEIVLLAAGMGLVALHYGKTNHFWLGFGITLTVLSGIMLVADLFAESRADTYTTRIEQIQQ
jgi:hypothetical protein